MSFILISPLDNNMCLGAEEANMEARGNLLSGNDTFLKSSSITELFQLPSHTLLLSQAGALLLLVVFWSHPSDWALI